MNDQDLRICIHCCKRVEVQSPRIIRKSGHREILSYCGYKRYLTNTIFHIWIVTLADMCKKWLKRLGYETAAIKSEINTLLIAHVSNTRPLAGWSI